MNSKYNNNRLMFITNPTEQYTELQETLLVLEGGCRWVQLRMKENPCKERAKELIKVCKDYNACFCIDDQIEMALELGADAVHLGKNDMPIAEARQLVNKANKNDFIIGATANSFEDIYKAAQNGASYIGLGPYQFTKTKKKLSPILGLDGYKKIMDQCKEAGITLPVYAIGGIELKDISALMKTGITGIAISGSILRAKEPIKETAKFIETIMTSI